jgi:hypothetical protein
MFLSGTRFDPARAGINATIVGCFFAIEKFLKFSLVVLK